MSGKIEGGELCEICGLHGKGHDCESPSSLSPALDYLSGIELAVCNDIAARQAFGVNKYGTTVADNPLELKAWLQHAYEECLDQAIYLKRAMREMENEKGQP